MTLIEFVGIVTHVLREYHRWGLSFTSDPSTAELTASSHQFTEHNNFDGLDKAFVLFRLPPKPSEDGTGTVQRRLTRRVDFIMAPKAKYALAVLGWSGSMMFERDLKYVAQTLCCLSTLTAFSLNSNRRYAENEMQVTLEQGMFTKQLTLPVYRNLKFDSGRFADRSTGEEYFPKTEREIFDILALRYVRPKWRNADA
jgi:DNA polymerase mu